MGVSSIHSFAMNFGEANHSIELVGHVCTRRGRQIRARSARRLLLGAFPFKRRRAAIGRLAVPICTLGLKRQVWPQRVPGWGRNISPPGTTTQRSGRRRRSKDPHRRVEKMHWEGSRRPRLLLLLQHPSPWPRFLPSTTARHRCRLPAHQTSTAP